MNWDRNHWTPNASNGTENSGDGQNYLFSNINHTWGETLNSGPFAVECKDMADANKMTLQFFRQACRLLPAIVNRQGNDALMDHHKSKINLAKWIRKGSNMRDLTEITDNIRVAYDFLFACAYCEFEKGYFNRFLVENPNRFDGGRFTNVDKSRGLNLIDQNRFKGKSDFLKRFVKGVRPLMH
jgi:hypothetical protein